MQERGSGARALEQVHAVILAGGLGMRLRCVLGECPKPMARVEGRPFVEWVAADRRRLPQAHLTPLETRLRWTIAWMERAGDA